MPKPVTVKLEIELEIDPDTYYDVYGVAVDDLVEDVRSYAVELFHGCAAAAEGCWETRSVQARRGRPARPIRLGL